MSHGNPFLDQLAELAYAEPTRPKWVFVPDHATGHTLGERLAREGTNWVNLRFTTPRELALLMAAPYLVECGVDPMPDGLGPALLMRLLMDLPEGVPSYFRKLGLQPAMAEALWSTLSETRLAGVTADDFRAGACQSPSKHAELFALSAAYERHLAERKLADVADVLREALKHREYCPIGNDDVTVELPDAGWPPLVQRLLESLPGRRMPSATTITPGLPLPRRLSPRFPLAPLSQPTTILGWMMAPEQAPTSTKGTVEFFRSGGREAEVEEVFRRVLGTPMPLDQVEIACASDADVSIVWEKAVRHDLPITVGSGLPVTLTRSGRALLAFLSFVDAGLPATDLRRMLQSGDVRIDVEGLSTGQAARILRASEATWGRAAFAPALARLAASYELSSRSPDLSDEDRTRAAARAERTKLFAAWVEKLLGLAPVPDGTKAGLLSSLVTSCRTFVERIAVIQGDLDASAAVGIVASLEELRALGELRRSLSDLVSLVRHQVERVVVNRDRARPGHLFVTALRHAGGSGRPNTFVVGLEEGRLLPPLHQDPVLDDAERLAISDTLATSADRAAEALFTVVRRLGSLQGRVVLSYSCRDLAEYRETFPSWVVLQALRASRRSAAIGYRQIHELVAPLVTRVPPDRTSAIARMDWWLSSVRGGGTRALAAVRSAFPDVARGLDAAEARRDSSFGAHDGHVPDAAAHLLPDTQHAISATTLEELAECPFRFFLRFGLGIEDVEDREPSRDEWLDPLARGSLLHDLYARLLRELRMRDERCSVERHRALLHDLAGQRLSALAATMPPPSAEVFERERDDLLRDLDLFLRLEEQEDARTPVAFELSFGVEDLQGEPLARTSPVLVRAGDVRIALRGRIDRVDRLGPGRYEVVDYKTGRFQSRRYKGVFAGGRRLQHALYALAARELLKEHDADAHVESASYYHPTARGEGRRVTFQGSDLSAVTKLLPEMLRIIRNGAFLHAPDDDACRFCHFSHACGPDAPRFARSKLEYRGNRSLEPYRTLGQHE